MRQARARRRESRVSSVLTAGVLLGLIILGLWIFRPAGPTPEQAKRVLDAGSLVRGTITAVVDAPCAPGGVSVPGGQEGCHLATVVLKSGPDAGSTVQVPVYPSGIQAEAGEDVYLQAPPSSSTDAPYALVDHVRSTSLVWLGVLFAVVVIALGRWKGVTALLSLVVSVGILVLYVLPAIVRGGSPVPVAVVGSAAVAYVVLYLTHGINAQTTVALLGTLAGLAITVVLAAMWVPFAKLSGLAGEDALFARALGIAGDPTGLLIAGFVIGALGAIDDVAVTQASTVWEVRAANPSMNVAALARAGLRVGRDHVGSIVNTLVLAYAGASLPLLMLFALSNRPLVQQLNGEIIAVEIVRTLTGSVGLVLAVPITTLLAAWAVDREGRVLPSPGRMEPGFDEDDVPDFPED